MKKPVALTAALLVLVMPLLGGCIAEIGSHAAPRPTATLGQQLIDLQKARDSGALSEPEYQAQRAKFLAER